MGEPTGWEAYDEAKMLVEVYNMQFYMKRYNGDKLGPTYDALKEAGKCDMDIIHSASRPNINIDKLLSGFEEWLRWQ